MPEAWSDQDERMYEHVKRSERQRGKSKNKAKEIAASRVNEQRRKENRTENETSSGSGNPNTRLEGRTVAELRNRAQELDIAGRSKMNKDELIKEIRKHN